MSDGVLQGWSADPFGLHDERYFSAGSPTKLVRDGRAESYDEPPPGAFEPASVSGPAAGLAVPGGFAAGDPAASGAERPRGRELPGAYAGYAQAAAPAGDADRPGAGGIQHRRRRPVLAAVCLIATGAAVAALVFVVKWPASTSPAAPVSGAAFVTRSAQRTLAERTAGMTVAGTVHAGGQALDISGTGQVDFSTDSTSLTMHFGASGQQATEQEILTGGSLYFALSVNGHSLGQVTGGKNWIQLPVQTSSSASLTGSDPQTTLLLLEQHGDTVRNLGTMSVGGVDCTGYSVTPSQQAMAAAEQKQITALGMSAQVAAALRSLSPPTLTVCLDQHGLLRQASTSLQLGGLTGSAASGDVVETFTRFGMPVQVTAPAAADVLSYETFVKDAAKGSS
jgi:hypothetical protein